jgi:hypothetical protein
MNQFEGEMMQKYICYELMNIRIDKNLKEYEVSNLLNLNLDYLVDIENGNKGSLPLCIYIQLCDLYSVDLSQVFNTAKTNLAMDRGYPNP